LDSGTILVTAISGRQFKSAVDQSVCLFRNLIREELPTTETIDHAAAVVRRRHESLGTTLSNLQRHTNLDGRRVVEVADRK
jgi:hypothetical protein